MDFKIDKSWTLFLDRDGVINERIFGGYVSTPDQFHFLDGVPEAILEFRKMFQRAIVITNQQCIGKNIISRRNLNDIHRYMQEQLMLNDTHLDAVYYAPEMSTDPDSTRKPKPYMGIEAQKDFPEIDFSKSWMVGDTDSDILFGKNLGMKTARIVTEEPVSVAADISCNSLYELALIMKKENKNNAE